MTGIAQAGQSGGNAVAAKRVDITYRDNGQFSSIARYADLAGNDLVAHTASAYDDEHRLTNLDHQAGTKCPGRIFLELRRQRPRFDSRRDGAMPTALRGHASSGKTTKCTLNPHPNLHAHSGQWAWHPAFKVIVGEAKHTKGGLLKGSILDATDTGLLEIKGGGSVLNSTYQLRLQTYRSLIEGQQYTIRTTRPLNPAFRDWLQRWGVKAEGIE